MRLLDKYRKSVLCKLFLCILAIVSLLMLALYFGRQNDAEKYAISIGPKFAQRVRVATFKENAVSWARGFLVNSESLLVPAHVVKSDAPAFIMTDERDIIRFDQFVLFNSDILISPSGNVEILSISACPELPENTTGVVRAVYETHGVGAVDLWLSGADEPIGVTTSHPVFSIDRDGWVEVGMLRTGEQLMTMSGDVVSVVDFALREQNSLVYNFEVHGDHTYYVGLSHLWVHNGRPPRMMPHAGATGSHSTWGKSPSNGYTTWVQNTNPQDPRPFEPSVRYDGPTDPPGGGGHFNKATGQDVPTPHVHDLETPGGVHPPAPNEIPKKMKPKCP